MNDDKVFDPKDFKIVDPASSPLPFVMPVGKIRDLKVSIVKMPDSKFLVIGDDYAPIVEHSDRRWATDPLGIMPCIR